MELMNHVINPTPLQNLENLMVGGTGMNGLGSDGLGSDGSVYLTPDALMAYCESRLKSLDDQAQKAFVSQEQRNGEQHDLQTLLGQFQKYASGIGSVSTQKGDKEKCEQLANALGDEITKLKNTDPSNPALPKLIQAYNDFVWTGCGGQDPNVNPTGQSPFQSSYIDAGQYPPHTGGGKEGDGILGDAEMQGFITDLQGASSDLSSCDELQMIQLQSVMSQRQTAIQLTTNLVQSLGDQMNKIADNIGH